MAYTEAQWNDLMNNLPPEDRSTYADYLSTLPVVDTSTGSLNDVFAQYWADSANYWLTQADKQAADAAAMTAALDAQYGCPAGTTSDGMGNCIPDRPCAMGYTMDASGNCVPIDTSCPSGYIKDSSGNCIPIQRTPTCPAGYIMDAFGNCVRTTSPYVQPYVSPYVPPYVNPYVPPYVPPTPPPPPPPVVIPAPPIKSGTPQYVLFNEDLVPPEIMVDLLFEDIGGEELLTIARTDTVNGQNVAYQPFKNLDIIQQQFSPTNIIKLQQTSETFFANFPIQLNTKIPNYGDGPDGATIYLNTSDLNFINKTDIEVGALVIDLVNLLQDEQVEVQISINGTIYESGV